jgi:uncharacterized membrane protein
MDYMFKEQKINFWHLTIVFFVFSFIGWAYEIVLGLILGYVCDPGFCVGPYLAVYGITIVSVYLLLGSRKDRRGIIKIITEYKPTMVIMKTLVYMLVSGLIVTLVELFAASILHVNFNVRLWDYSVLPYNFRGYISLPSSLLWIVLIPLIMFIGFDFVHERIKKIPNKLSKILGIMLISLFIIDILFNVSFILINGYSFRFI